MYCNVQSNPQRFAKNTMDLNGMLDAFAQAT